MISLATTMAAEFVSFRCWPEGLPEIFLVNGKVIFMAGVFHAGQY